MGGGTTRPGRLFLAGLVLGAALMGGAGPIAALTGPVSDPAGDNGHDFDARGDIVGFSVTHDGANVTLTMTTRVFDNPLTSSNWIPYANGTQPQSGFLVRLAALVLPRPSASAAKDREMVVLNDGSQLIALMVTRDARGRHRSTRPRVRTRR